eukprot:g3008.t1
MSRLGLSDPWGSTSKNVDNLFKRSKRGYMERQAGKLRIVRVTKGSPIYNKAADVLAKGECGTKDTAPDPLLDWVYSERKEGICSALPENPSEHRSAWFKFLARFMLDFGVSRGGAYALVDPEKNEVVAATVTAPPRTVHNLIFTCHQADLREAGMGMAIQVLTHRRLHKLGKWQQHLQDKLSLGTNFLEVMMFATVPEHQGKGYGTALLQFLAEIADVDGVVSLLETAGTRNTAFYAKTGFEEYSRAVLSSFDYQGGGVGMLRKPKTK